MSKSQSSSEGARGKKRKRKHGSSTPKHGSHSKGARSSSNQKKERRSKANDRKPTGRTGSSRPIRSDSTGSMPATNPSLGRTGSAQLVKSGTTGSMSAANPNRVRSASESGNYAATSKRSRRKRQAPRHAAPAKRHFPVWRVFLIILILAGLGVGGYFGVRYILHPYEGAKVEDGQTVTVVIPDGSSGSDIIQALLDAGVIHSSKDFRKAVQEQNADQSLRSGTYTFVTGSDCNDIVRQLVTGPNSSEGQLQLPEGLTLTQTAELVEKSLGIPKQDFINQAKASNYVDDYPFLKNAGKDSLEGYLYPKTYDLSGKDIKADTVIRLMLDQFQSEVHGLDLAGAEKKLAERYNLNVTDYDILKIASIIEKEATSEEDRPLVSSVFYNRLSVGKALESDATMGYETGGAVTSEDLAKDSPYNTYLHKGLPPTPICSPSLWNIQAAMEPADTEYMYFFIIETDGYSKHTYSKTYEEHDEAYAAALKEMEAAKGESK